jgi:hypothetical protein
MSQIMGGHDSDDHGDDDDEDDAPEPDPSSRVADTNISNLTGPQRRCRRTNAISSAANPLISTNRLVSPQFLSNLRMKALC